MTGLKQLSAKTRTFFLVSIIFLVSFGVYFNSLFNGFVLDDSFHILDNRWIKDIRYLSDILTSNFWMGSRTSLYRPVIHIIFMTGYHLFGLAPWGFHLMNILLHSGATLLAFLIISRLLRKDQSQVAYAYLPVNGENSWLQRIAFIAALLFATHPIHAESVAWISGITDVSCAFSYLLSFYLYVRSSEGKRAWGTAYVFSVVSFFLAALCKEPALTLPAILVVYDYVFRKEGKGVSYYAKRYIPYLVAGGIYFALRLRALGGMVTFKTPLKLSPYEYLIDILALFTKYLEKLLLPVNLNVLHVFQPPATLISLSGMVSLFVAAAFIIAAVVAIRKKKVALLGLMFMLFPLLPALYLPGLVQGLENAFAERYLYLPSFGFILLAALFIARIRVTSPRWTAVLISAFSSIVVLYSLGTANRVVAWKDNFTIWSDAARKSPSSAVARSGLAAALKERGRLDDAIKEYQVAVRLDPKYPFAHASLGLVYVDKGWTDKAMEQFQIALSLKPGYAEAHDFLGVLYGSLGQHDKAVREFELALNLNPDLDYVYKHLGIAYNNLGMTDKAMEYFQTALRLNPDDADAHNNLGVVYAERGMMDEAAGHFEAAAKLNPSDPSLHYNAARAYQALGRADKAEEHLRRARTMDRGNP